MDATEISLLLSNFNIDAKMRAAIDAALLPFMATEARDAAISAGQARVRDFLANLQLAEIRGFKGGWVSFPMLQRRLQVNEIGMSERELRDFLKAEGYVRHPGLANGRTNNRVMPDNRKTVLYVKLDHSSIAFPRPCDIEKAYTRDQGRTT